MILIHALAFGGLPSPLLRFLGEAGGTLLKPQLLEQLLDLLEDLA